MESGHDRPYTHPDYVAEVIRRLRLRFPDAHCELDYDSPIHLLAATILSAQCTDERVNQITPALFARYPTVVDFAEADQSELEEVVRPTGFYRQKSRYIREASQLILLNFGGEVPASMDDLLQLPGVARKTANVVRGEIYGLSDGITVDTHVKRVSARLGFTTQTDPDKVERDLMAIIPRESWLRISHLLVWLGRRICKARVPDCPNCPLNDICPSSTVRASV